MGRKAGNSNGVTRAPLVGGPKVIPLRVVNATPSEKTAKPEIPREQIARRAYDLWVKHGCQHGWDQQHWLEAERQLKAELGVT